MYIRKVEFFDAGWRALITSAASITVSEKKYPSSELTPLDTPLSSTH